MHEKLSALVKRWRKEAEQYAKQIEEARSKNLPCDQALSMMTCLRGCAKELEYILISQKQMDGPKIS